MAIVARRTERLTEVLAACTAIADRGHVMVAADLSDLDAIGQAIAQAVTRTGGPVPATGTAPGAPVALTDVQLETLRLVAAGYTNEQIAAERVVTQKSVEVTIARLSRRLGIPAGRAANQRVLLTRAHYQLSGQLPRAGDPPALFADSSKAIRELDWKVRFPDIDSIVATAWRWHSSHPKGYADR